MHDLSCRALSTFFISFLGSSFERGGAACRAARGRCALHLLLPFPSPFFLLSLPLLREKWEGARDRRNNELRVSPVPLFLSFPPLSFSLAVEHYKRVPFFFFLFFFFLPPSPPEEEKINVKTISKRKHPTILSSFPSPLFFQIGRIGEENYSFFFFSPFLRNGKEARLAKPSLLFSFPLCFFPSPPKKNVGRGGISRIARRR